MRVIFFLNRAKSVLTVDKLRLIIFIQSNNSTEYYSIQWKPNFVSVKRTGGRGDKGTQTREIEAAGRAARERLHTYKRAMPMRGVSTGLKGPGLARGTVRHPSKASGRAAIM